ncbi:hypothetical protein EG68_01788 [Paragonimus skrjabini miyazakii]|uniref:Phosphodiesterase n=1 Tax=Paragonimus skrjabini miyazakii TaxID=59628 RepID=A0A8S9YZR0_9TREM|nr:hypothetical protein EG68_01788 [Paragonimus skrjabini miyazakii]
MLSRELSTSFSQSEATASSVPSRVAGDGEEDSETNQVFREGSDISKRSGVGRGSTGGSTGSDSYRQRPYLSKSGLTMNQSSCSSQISDYIYQTFVEGDMDEFFELNLKQNSHIGADLIQRDDKVSKTNGTEKSNVPPETIHCDQTLIHPASEKTSSQTKSSVNEVNVVDMQTSMIQLWNSQNDIDTKQVMQFIQASGNSFAPDLFLLDQTSNHHTLSTFGLYIMQESGILQKMSIPLRQMHLCLIHVEASYNALAPFHNSIHATDVLQAMQTLFRFNKLESMFTDLEVFATLFACIVHDIDHPALTNQYLINTNNKLALLYNDNSVLENHHLHVAFSLLHSKPECDITAGFTHQQRQLFRKVVISLVLSTDMSKHMTLLADLKTMVESQRASGSNVINLDNYSSRIQILECLVHASDLSNPTRPLPIYRQWVERIMEELFQQGDKERAAGVEISPMCDRETACINTTQVSFIDYIVYPLWETLGELFYSEAKPLLENISANRRWFEEQTSLHENHQHSDKSLC